MIEAVQLMGERHKGERVAGVTHAVMIRLVAAKLLNLDGEEWRIPVGRGSLTKFEVENGADPPGGDARRRRRRLSAHRGPLPGPPRPRPHRSLS